jgi:hypothetical protein
MSTLNDALAGPGSRAQVISDCQTIIDEEVSSKGLTGIPIKAAYAVVKAVKPGFVPEVIDHMLDDFCRRLDPIYPQARAKNEPVTAYFKRAHRRGGRGAAADHGRARAAGKEPDLEVGVLEAARGAKKHVEAAVPRIARLVDKHTRPSASAPASA